MDDEWVWRDFLGGKRVEPKLGEVLDRLLLPVSKRYGSAAAVLAELSPSKRPSPVPPQFKMQFITPPKSQSQATRQPLISQTTGTDYRELNRALRHREWKKADELTRNLMLKVANRTRNGWLGKGSIENFPGEDLKLIDNLWVQHSEGKLGFSVQKRIWQECGSPGFDYAANKAAWKKFGQRVNWQGGTGYDGWRYVYELDYANPQKCSGHLPCPTHARHRRTPGLVFWGVFYGNVYFFSRAEI